VTLLGVADAVAALIGRCSVRLQSVGDDVGDHVAITSSSSPRAGKVGWSDAERTHQRIEIARAPHRDQVAEHSQTNPRQMHRTRMVGQLRIANRLLRLNWRAADPQIEEIRSFIVLTCVDIYLR
jgi:hypothetical protein